MDRRTFNIGFTTLVNAFTYAAERVTLESQDIYWEMLHGIPDAAFNQGVRKCLADCKFFPSIAELGEASLPPQTRFAPYNPRVYLEPRKIGWREQVQEMSAEQKAIPPEIKSLVSDISKSMTVVKK